MYLPSRSSVILSAQAVLTASSTVMGPTTSNVASQLAGATGIGLIPFNWKV